MPTPSEAAAELLARRKARRSIIDYSQYMWPGYMAAAHHHLIARHLEAVDRGEIKRLMINMPPRHGKSMLASEFFPSWWLGKNPDKYIVMATYAQDLADDFGRKVKGIMEDDYYRNVFPNVELSKDSKSSKRFHVKQLDGTEIEGGIERVTSQKGAFYAVGVGGPLTGRGAHLMLVDDPIKNREDAESEIMRKKLKDWYSSTAYTRLMPGGAIVVIQCMVGSTPVLMADGSMSALKDVRPGDMVATYDQGVITSSKVLNWARQGADSVFTITTTSGTTVTANARHPFLVDRNGAQEWVRLKDLRIGDKALRVIGGNGEASPAHTKGASNQPRLEATATRTTTKFAGQTESDLHQSMLHPDALLTCATDTELTNTNTTRCLKPRAGVALYAKNCPEITSGRIGEGSCASITATKQEKFEDSSVTTATLPLGMESQKRSCSQPLDTYKITLEEIVSIDPAGVEDVYDIQVERTENFIANGLVSHNTRWHEDDLSGWLLDKHQHEGWVVLNLPAIDENDQALWPEQYPIETLHTIRKTLTPRDWSALYQQAPSPDTGDYFKREWLRVVPASTMPPKHTLSIYGASDYAVTADGGDYTVHVVVGVDSDGRLWLLDMWRAQASSDVWVDAFCQLVQKWKPIGWAEETGQIKSGVGPFLVKRMIETGSFVAREQFATRGDKAVRAQSIRGRMALSGLYVRDDLPGLEALISEMMSFPVGVHDDQCLSGETLITMADGSRKPIREVEKGDGVLTPGGERTVTASVMTNSEAAVYSVALSDGRCLIATGSHPVFVKGKGFTRVDALGIMDEIESETLCAEDLQKLRLLNTKATDTGDTRIANLCREHGISMLQSLAGALCIDTYGKTTTGQYLPTTISTTRTKIGTITPSKTLSAFQSLSTGDGIPCLLKDMRNRLSIWQGYATKPLNGIGRLKEWLGIKSTARNHGRGEQPQPVFAMNALTSIPLTSKDPGSAAVHVLSVTGIKGNRPVYNLTVDGEHVYYANGILTHNCDALGLAGQLMDRMHMGVKPKPEEPKLEVGAIYAPALPRVKRRR